MSRRKDETYSKDKLNEIARKNNIAILQPVNLENYKSISVEEMATDTPPPQEYIFHPCLPTQGIAWIYAPSGIGKTLFTANLAYAIANGGSFLKYKCPIPRKVLYVDGEMAYNQLYSRIMTIREREGKLDYPENLQFLTPDKILPFRMPKMDTIEGQNIYTEKLLKEEFEVIVFDNLTMLSAFDENSAQEWKPIGDWQLHLRSLGKTIINVHHSGKDAKVYRGSSAMIASADVVISLQPVNENDLEDELINCKKFKVKYEKARNFSGQDALPFEVNFMNKIWSFQSLERTEMERVVEMTNLKMTQTNIAKELNCGQSKVAKLAGKARRLGLLPS